jgi:catechol 2,3-dioxygenase-like lactoylglutathione lyase family enzyme
MIHVPDVQATVDWYDDIGFTIVETHGHEGEGLSFAIISFGDTEVMFSEGGRPSTQRRREVDLYVYTHDIDGLYERLKDRGRATGLDCGWPSNRKCLRKRGTRKHR